MNSKELAKFLSEKGLTPDQVARIVDRYEKQKEKHREYQKRKYYRVSISVPKERADRISQELNIPVEYVKKFLAGVKAVNSIPREVREKLKKFLRNELSG